MLFETNSVAVMLALMSERWRRNNRVMSLLPSGIDATHHDQGERQRYGCEELCNRHSYKTEASRQQKQLHQQQRIR